MTMESDCLTFNATKAQVLQMIANAANMSMPSQAWEEVLYKEDDFEHLMGGSIGRRSIEIQYYDGRCIRLRFQEVTRNRWITPNYVDHKYHSWAKFYGSRQELVNSVIG